ncbi:hypothetical protein ACPESV_02815 [Streptomyces umbrinus]|uniref:hypothetical protein n=1 Tax=Streptomyces umbrinus TaxID=67370 RepID=UPI003C2EE67A
MTGTHKDTTITRRRAIAVTGGTVAGSGGGGGTPPSGAPLCDAPSDAPSVSASSTDASS